MKKYSLEPAYRVYDALSLKLFQSSTLQENQWFFTAGGFNPDLYIQRHLDTYDSEDFAVVYDGEIIGFFSGPWNKCLRCIHGFRFIFFSKKYTLTLAKAFFDYLEYLFLIRGCENFTWLVAEKNGYAKCLYDKFISNYCGRIIGKQTRGQMSYSGEISDVYLYEITKADYFKYRKVKKGV